MVDFGFNKKFWVAHVFFGKNYATRKAVYYALVIPDDTTIWRELFKFGRKSQEKDCWHAGTALIGNTSKCCAKAQFASISAWRDKARGKARRRIL